MAGPAGNSEFCFPFTSFEGLRETNLNYYCFPWGQSLSAYYSECQSSTLSPLKILDLHRVIHISAYFEDGAGIIRILYYWEYFPCHRVLVDSQSID